MASNSKQTAERRTRNQALDLRAGQDNRRRQWTLSKDSGISASSGSQDSIDLISKKEENSAEGENVQISAALSSEQDGGNSETSNSDQQGERKKIFRKTRKKSLSLTNINSNEDNSSDNEFSGDKESKKKSFKNAQHSKFLKKSGSASSVFTPDSKSVNTFRKKSKHFILGASSSPEVANLANCVGSDHQTFLTDTIRDEVSSRNKNPENPTVSQTKLISNDGENIEMQMDSVSTKFDVKGMGQNLSKTGSNVNSNQQIEDYVTRTSDKDSMKITDQKKESIDNGYEIPIGKHSRHIRPKGEKKISVKANIGKDNETKLAENVKITEEKGSKGKKEKSGKNNFPKNVSGSDATVLDSFSNRNIDNLLQNKKTLENRKSAQKKKITQNLIDKKPLINFQKESSDFPFSEETVDTSFDPISGPEKTNQYKKNQKKSRIRSESEIKLLHTNNDDDNDSPGNSKTKKIVRKSKSQSESDLFGNKMIKTGKSNSNSNFIKLEDDEVFASDSLPNYAKSYILPKIMKKDVVDARIGETGKRNLTSKPSEDKSMEAFKFSMLKASLDFDSGFQDVDDIFADPVTTSEKSAIKKLSSESGPDLSGRTTAMSLSSTSMSQKRNAKKLSSKSRINCTGPGTIDQYAKYVKSGGFVPLPILEPEKGVEASLFALHPGLDALDEGGTFIVSKNKKSPFKGTPTVEEINGAIHQQFNKICEKFGEPTIVIKSLDKEDQKAKNTEKPKGAKTKKKSDDLLNTEVSPKLSSDDDDEDDFSTWLESSDAQLFNDNSVMKDFLDSNQKEKIFGGENTLLRFAEKQDVRTTKIIQDAMAGNNLLGMMDESKDRYGNGKGDMSGSDALDMFIDPSAVFGSDRHPALMAVLKQVDSSKRKRAEKLKLQEELFKLQSARRNHEERKTHLLNKAKVLQARAAKFKSKVTKEVVKMAGVWEHKLVEEEQKTSALEQVCAALREDLDFQHKKRIEDLETKIKPVIVKDGPSKKANYKILAARFHCEIYAVTQRIRLLKIRVEQEQSRRESREKEVRILRECISEKRSTITTATKGIPFSKLEVRPFDQLPNFSGPTETGNPLLNGMPSATFMAGKVKSFSKLRSSSMFDLTNFVGFD